MNFYDWETHYEVTKKQVASNGIKLTYDIYEETCRLFEDTIYFPEREMDQLLLKTELIWLQEKKPYYNIHSNIFDSTERMRLDKIPVKFLDVPRPYETILIRFPNPNKYELKGILTVKTMTQLFFFIRTLNDCAERKFDYRLGFVKLSLDRELSIEEYISKSLKEGEEAQHYGRQMFEEDKKICLQVSKHAIRFYALTQFLNNYPTEEFIEYDVTNNLKGSYNIATPERKKEIEEYCKVIGRRGWNIGVNERVLGKLGRLSIPRTNETEQERELRHAHIRTGHLHCVRFGPGKEQVKVLWFQPTVVRPDLPFKDSEID